MAASPNKTEVALQNGHFVHYMRQNKGIEEAWSYLQSLPYEQYDFRHRGLVPRTFAVHGFVRLCNCDEIDVLLGFDFWLPLSVLTRTKEGIELLRSCFNADRKRFQILVGATPIITGPGIAVATVRAGSDCIDTLQIVSMNGAASSNDITEDEIMRTQEGRRLYGHKDRLTPTQDGRKLYLGYSQQEMGSGKHSELCHSHEESYEYFERMLGILQAFFCCVTR
ncbi:hypothetical protein LTR81_026981 [Elasticomyces elasticus]